MAQVPLAGQPSGAALAAIRSAVDLMPLAAVAHTTDFEIVAANQRCAEMLGVPVGAIQGRTVAEFIPVPARGTARDAASETLAAVTDPDRPEPTRTWSSFRSLIRADGSHLTCWMHVGIADVAGHRLFIVCMDLVNPVVSDADEWRRRADHDELTGLLRRGPLLSHLNEWVRTDGEVDLAYFDVDDFKSVNDTHGHACGDHVLSVLARRLAQVAPPDCIVARLSGDEFVLARPHAGLGSAAGRTPAWDLVRAVQRCTLEPIAWNEHLLMLSASVGGVSRQRGEDAATLLARADAAMYTDKLGRERRRIVG